MATNRTPINRPSRSRITPEAVAIFKRVRAKPIANYGDAALCEALGLLPWQMVVDPDNDTHPGYVWRDEGVKLFLELEALADADK